MSHEDLLKDLMSVIQETYNPDSAATRYHVTSRKFLQLATTLEYLQEQRNTPLVETYNQQQIFIWVKNHINLLLVQGQGYIEWDICEACERRILMKSRYSEILE